MRGLLDELLDPGLGLLQELLGFMFEPITIHYHLMDLLFCSLMDYRYSPTSVS